MVYVLRSIYIYIYIYIHQKHRLQKQLFLAYGCFGIEIMKRLVPLYVFVMDFWFAQCTHSVPGKWYTNHT